MRSIYRSVLVLAVAAALPACGGGGGGGGGGATPVMLVSSVGAVQGNATSDSPSISSNGRYIAFRTDATNLEAPATTLGNIYVKDMNAGGVLRASRRSAADGNVQPNAASFSPSISPDGNLIAYVSAATDILPGGYVADAGGPFNKVYLYNIMTNSTTLISHSTVSSANEANGHSASPKITMNGATVHITYESFATNIVTGTYTASTSNIFRWSTGDVTALVSIDDTSATVAGNASSTRPTISANGRFISFESTATNLLGAGQDTNATSDIYVRDMNANDITRVSVTDGEGQADGAHTMASISPDGLDVAFLSTASTTIVAGAVDNDIILRRDWNSGAAGTTMLVSVHPVTNNTGNSCQLPVLSQDGNLVIWHSGSDVLVNGDTNLGRDLFQRNVTGNTLVRLSLTNAGVEAGSTAPTTGGATAIISRPALTADGLFVAFDSLHKDHVVPNTTVRQVFRRG